MKFTTQIALGIGALAALIVLSESLSGRFLNRMNHL